MLKILIDKAYPHLEAAARDQMALTHFLAQLRKLQSFCTQLQLWKNAAIQKGINSKIWWKAVHLN